MNTGSQSLSQEFLNKPEEELRNIANGDPMFLRAEAIDAARSELERRTREGQDDIHCQYKAIGHDGYEYSELDRADLLALYASRKLTKESLVFDPKESQWLPIDRVVDLQQREGNDHDLIVTPTDFDYLKSAPETKRIRPQDSAGGVSEPQAPSGESDIQAAPLFGSYNIEQPPINVLRFAGVLLIVSAVIGLILEAAQQSSSSSAKATGMGVLLDLACGVGLLRSNGWLGMDRNKWRLWTIGRALLGALVFGLVMPLTERHERPLWWATSILVLLLCAGFLILLYAPPPKVWRLWVGGGAAISALAVALMMPFIGSSVSGYVNKSRVAGSTLPGNQFVDNEKRIHLDLPDGWLMVRNENEYFPIPNASVTVFHPASGTFAALITESIIVNTLGPTPLDRYLELVMQNRKKADPSVQELKRIPDKLAGRSALQSNISWILNGEKFLGYQTACYDGSRFFLFTSAASADMASESEAAYHELLSKFSIVRTAEDEEHDQAAKLSQEYPYLTPDAAMLMVEEITSRGMDASQAGRFSRELSEEGFALLPSKESNEAKSLMRNAVERLPTDEKKRFYDYFRRSTLGQTFSPTERDDLGEITKHYLSNIPEKDLPRLQYLFEKALRAALEKRR
jgi:hypothetical protein